MAHFPSWWVLLIGQLAFRGLLLWPNGSEFTLQLHSPSHACWTTTVGEPMFRIPTPAVPLTPRGRSAQTLPTLRLTTPLLLNTSTEFVELAHHVSVSSGMPQQGGKLQKPLAVNGIKLGDYYGHVLDILGKPLKEKRTFNAEVPVSNTEWRRFLEYDGAYIELASGKRSGPFYVVSINISGKQWKLSHGLRIGMSEMEVTKALGPANESRSNASQQSTTLWYICDGEGWATFDFSQGHLKIVQWSIDLA